MHHLKQFTTSQLLLQAAVGYGTATYASYKYNSYIKA